MTDYLIVDDNGIPEAAVNSDAITDAGFTLALRLGAAGDNQDAINKAIASVLREWDQSARYVIVSALVQLTRDLVPMVASLAKASTGVDWHAHCKAMLAPGEYDPRTVDQEGGNASA
ncbi:hypothetical protein ACP6NG_06715 [Brevibacterium casei]|uniref:Uncharacterized protein n=1 Tax=Brevibacterium casei TaxID=33889 RepID=A0A449CYB4_9MICO|nr:hypothetical protein [Brevibacterium casei]VEW10361.1 Uncharacterised protein [Brevibacterium casei]